MTLVSKRELHITGDTQIYHCEFHTTDYKGAIVTIISHKTGKIIQQNWRRVEDEISDSDGSKL